MLFDPQTVGRDTKRRVSDLPSARELGLTMFSS
jgi:hypothetical protein